MNDTPETPAVAPDTAPAPAVAAAPYNSPTGTATVPEQPPQKTHLALPLVAVLVAVLALAGAAWTWSDSRERVRDLKTELGRRLAESGGQVSETRLLARNADDAMRQVSEKVARIETQLVTSQQQQLALEALYKDLAQGRDQWTLAEIEQVLSGTVRHRERSVVAHPGVVGRDRMETDVIDRHAGPGARLSDLSGMIRVVADDEQLLLRHHRPRNVEIHGGDRLQAVGPGTVPVRPGQQNSALGRGFRNKTIGVQGIRQATWAGPLAGLGCLFCLCGRHDGVQHRAVFEEHRIAVIIPAGDGWMQRTIIGWHRGVFRHRVAEFGTHRVHRHAPFWHDHLRRGLDVVHKQRIGAGRSRKQDGQRKCKHHRADTIHS